MRCILLIHLIFFGFNCFSQTGYKVVYNHAQYEERLTSYSALTNKNRKSTAFDYNIVFNDSLAYSFYGFNIRRNDTSKLYGKKAQHHDDFYNTATNAELGYTQHPNKKPLLVLRQTEYKNFVVQKDSFMLNGLLCAKGYYLDKTDTVFATISKEIKAPYGPYGFTGLPGLVIEIYFTASRNHFLLKSVIKDVVKIKIPDLPTITWQQFQDKYYKK